MQVKESTAMQNEIEKILQSIMTHIQSWDEDEAKRYAKELVELSRLRQLAKTGWLPDNEGNRQKFMIYRQFVYEVYFPPVIGSEQDLIRPAVVVRASRGPTVMVIPLTDERYGDQYDFHVDLINPFDPKKAESTALIDQFRTIDKRRIARPYRVNHHMVRLDDRDMLRILNALAGITQMNLEQIIAHRLEKLACQIM